MKYILKPSLEHMSLVKIAVTLWNENIKALMVKTNFSPGDLEPRVKRWNKIEDKIMAKALQLSLPQLLKDKILYFIKPIGLQILRWMGFHYSNTLTWIDLKAEFCWTSHGTIDRKKTAQLLIKDENIGVYTRLRIATSYCLDDDILKLRHKIPAYLREIFAVEEYPEVLLYKGILSYDCEIMKETGTEYDRAFMAAARKCNKAATEYFLRKLSPRRRRESLVEAAKSVNDADVLHFLLSEMDEEQQLVFFKSNSYEVLQCFLNWPFQGFFIELANHTLSYLSEWQYRCLLKKIINKVADGYKDWNYKKLFVDFWLISPIALKSLDIYVKDGIINGILFHFKDKEILKLILQDVTLTEKRYNIYEKLICSFSDEDDWHSLILDGDWDLLECLIRECKFKAKFEKRLVSLCVKHHLRKNKYKCDQLVYLSDCVIFKNNRSIAED